MVALFLHHCSHALWVTPLKQRNIKPDNLTENTQSAVREIKLERPIN